MAGSEISLRNKHPTHSVTRGISEINWGQAIVDSLSNLVTGPTIGTIQIQKDTP